MDNRLINTSNHDWTLITKLCFRSKRYHFFQNNDELGHVRRRIITFVAIQAVNASWSDWENFAIYLYWNTSDSNIWIFCRLRLKHAEQRFCNKETHITVSTLSLVYQVVMRIGYISLFSRFSPLIKTEGRAFVRKSKCPINCSIFV